MFLIICECKNMMFLVNKSNNSIKSRDYSNVCICFIMYMNGNMYRFIVSMVSMRCPDIKHLFGSVLVVLLWDDLTCSSHNNLPCWHPLLISESLDLTQYLHSVNHLSKGYGPTIKPLCRTHRDDETLIIRVWPTNIGCG